MDHLDLLNVPVKRANAFSGLCRKYLGPTLLEKMAIRVNVPGAGRLASRVLRGTTSAGGRSVPLNQVQHVLELPHGNIVGRRNIAAFLRDNRLAGRIQTPAGSPVIPPAAAAGSPVIPPSIPPAAAAGSPVIPPAAAAGSPIVPPPPVPPAAAGAAAAGRRQPVDINLSRYIPGLGLGGLAYLLGRPIVGGIEESVGSEYALNEQIQRQQAMDELKRQLTQYRANLGELKAMGL